MIDRSVDTFHSTNHRRSSFVRMAKGVEKRISGKLPLSLPLGLALSIFLLGLQGWGLKYGAQAQVSPPLQHLKPSEILDHLNSTSDGRKLLSLYRELSETNIGNELDAVGFKHSGWSSYLEQKTADGKDPLDAEKDYIHDFVPALRRLIPQIREQLTKVFRSQKSSAPPMVSDKILLDHILTILRAEQGNGKNVDMSPENLARLLTRDDILIDEKEYETSKAGYDDEAAEEYNSRKNYMSSAAFTEELQEAEQLIASLRGSPNYCNPGDSVCDRRKVRESCIALLPVENQGLCSSGWAFATSHATSILECHLTGRLNNYSEQELLDCAGATCGGGDPSFAYKWLQASNHLATEDHYPAYKEVRRGCRAKRATNDWRAFITADRPTTSSIKVNVKHGDWVKKIKTLVAAFGALPISINDIHYRYTGRKPAEYCERHGFQNHFVALVGWNKDPEGKEYWIFKNSRGYWFGDDGYGMIYIDTDCAPDENPFNEIVLPLTKDFSKSQPTANYDELPNKAVQTISFYEEALNCTEINEHSTIKILDARFHEFSEFFDKCNIPKSKAQESVQKLKDSCNGKDECWVSMTALSQNYFMDSGLEQYCRDKPPNQLRIEYDCTDRDSRSTLDTWERSPGTTKRVESPDRSQIDCNKATDQSGRRSVYCIMVCHASANECFVNGQSWDCIQTVFKEKYTGYLGSCRLDQVNPSTRDPNLPEIKAYIDCEKAKAIGRYEDKYCVQQCKLVKKKYWCKDDDYLCLHEGLLFSQLGKKCKFSPAWVYFKGTVATKNYYDQPYDCNWVTAAKKNSVLTSEQCMDRCSLCLNSCRPIPDESCMKACIGENKCDTDYFYRKPGRRPLTFKIDCSQANSIQGNFGVLTDAETCQNLCYVQQSHCKPKDPGCLLFYLDQKRQRFHMCDFDMVFDDERAFRQRPTSPQSARS